MVRQSLPLGAMPTFRVSRRTFGHHEPFPPSFSASCSRGCRVAGSLARGSDASYPSRPVRVVVGFSAGGAQDIVARLIGQWMSERLGQPFIIENRPGAASNVAAEAVVRSPADGYTLLLVGATNAINATLYDKLNFNFVRDIAPVASIGRTPLVMGVNPSVPARTVPELIAYAKANPGKINFGSGGNGTPSHVAGELFKMLTGTNLVHVPYRGTSPALTDLIAGHVQVMINNVSASIESIRAGKLRPLGVTTAMRLELLPDVPTVADFVPGYEASGWQGIGAPANTPREVIATLNDAINAALSDPKTKGRIADPVPRRLRARRASSAS
jgi:tripartite-type tricarboxylate transporter receptor subunit TctC